MNLYNTRFSDMADWWEKGLIDRQTVKEFMDIWNYQCGFLPSAIITKEGKLVDIRAEAKQ